MAYNKLVRASVLLWLLHPMCGQDLFLTGHIRYPWPGKSASQKSNLQQAVLFYTSISIVASFQFLYILISI